MHIDTSRLRSHIIPHEGPCHHILGTVLTVHLILQPKAGIQLPQMKPPQSFIRSPCNTSHHIFLLHGEMLRRSDLQVIYTTGLHLHRPDKLVVECCDPCPPTVACQLPCALSAASPAFGPWVMDWNVGNHLRKASQAGNGRAKGLGLSLGGSEGRQITGRVQDPCQPGSISFHAK